jgi:CubicO group peptidase (beta-lactamase class C family)
MVQGVDIGPQSRIATLMADRGPFANPDPRKSQITLAHLLTHSSGLDCNDNDEKSLGNEDTMSSQTAQPNWWKYTLDLPMLHNPGTRYAYCSANINLVGGALTVATQTWLPDYFERSIARPLEFARYYWMLSPTGEGYLGGGAFMRPRDLLKLGQMYLDKGVWNGKRIVSADWVRESTAAHIEINPTTTGLSAEDFGNSYAPGSDGYAWHRNGIRVGERVVETYAASGNGGQIVLVVPEYDLAVAFTGGNYRQGGIWGGWGDEFIGAEIIPAIKSE